MQINARLVATGGLRFEHLQLMRAEHAHLLGDDAQAVGAVLREREPGSLTFEQARAEAGADVRAHVSTFWAAFSNHDQLGGGENGEVWSKAVRITDLESGVLYDVELVGEGSDLRATSYSCTVADEGDLEGADVLSRSAAIDLAKRFHRGEHPEWVPGVNRRDLPPGPRYRRPELSKVAAVYSEAVALGKPVREHVRAAFGAASVQTVDGWIRAARDAELIPAASTGTPRKSTLKESPDA